MRSLAIKQAQRVVCVCVCLCVWFKLNAPFNQFCWHALLALPALLGDSLSLPPLILFNIFSATSASLSLHAMIPSCPHTPSLHPLLPYYSPCPAQSSLSHLPYLFIYLLSCLFIVLPLIAFVVSWPRDVASIFDFTFAFRIRPLSFMDKKKLKLILFDM